MNPALVDPGNRLLQAIPTDHTLETGTAWAPGGTQLAVVTIRTVSTTLTVMLTPEQLKNWVTLLGTLSGSMSAGGLAAGSAADIPRLGNGLS